VSGEHLVEALLRHATERPDKEAVAWLPDGEREAERLTYSGLVARVKASAAALQARGLEGQPVMIALPPGLDYLIAVLAVMFAGAIAVPMPERRREPLRTRWTAVLATLEPAAVIDSPIVPTGAAWRRPLLNDETTAYVQFTSGSTGAPKGVVIPHRALTENRAMMREVFAQDPDWRCVTWLPPWHDMGLVGGLLQPLGEGMFVAILPPLAVVQRPLRWLRSIDNYRATASGGPLFAYQACVKRVPDQPPGLDLSSWKLACCSSEPVRAGPLEAFATKFSPIGFDPSALYPCYGLAEATLFVTGPERGAGLKVFESDGRTLVSCGRPWLSGTVRIADPESGATLEPGVVGEIRVSGKHLSSGYWGETDAEDELRTGDLGLLNDGELFVVGRIKDILILRGAKYCAEDLEEAALAAHSAIRAAAAFAMDNGECELAILLIEAPRNVPPDELRQAVAATVLRLCGIRLDAVHVGAPGWLPRTSSGKLERHRCRAAFETDLATRLAQVA